MYLCFVSQLLLLLLNRAFKTVICLSLSRSRFFGVGEKNKNKIDFILSEFFWLKELEMGWEGGGGSWENFFSFSF
jgi:uncharacterized protein YdaU (DUF1376 family)